MLVAFCLLAEAQALLGVGPSTRYPARPRMGLSFPSVGTVPDLQMSRDRIVDLGVQAVRISENWKTREASEGVYSWSGLDIKIDTLRSSGARIFLTIESDGPAWRCGVSNARSCVFNDLPAFRAYVTALCRRYRGRIHAMQFGNEAYSTYWYAGTASEFIAAANAFYDVVRAEMPGVPVVLAGFQTLVLHLFAVCDHGRAIPTRNASGTLLDAAGVAALCADAAMRDIQSRFTAITARARYNLVDIHFYDNMEYWGLYMQTLRALLPGKLTVATELGCPNKRYESLADTFHADRVGRLLATARSLGVLEAYYFKLVEYPSSEDAEHEKSGLLGYPELDAKPAYDSIRAFNAR